MGVSKIGASPIYIYTYIQLIIKPTGRGHRPILVVVHASMMESKDDACLASLLASSLAALKLQLDRLSFTLNVFFSHDVPINASRRHWLLGALVPFDSPVLRFTAPARSLVHVRDPQPQPPQASVVSISTGLLDRHQPEKEEGEETNSSCCRSTLALPHIYKHRPHHPLDRSCSDG